MDATPTRSNITSYGSAIPIQPGDTFTLELPDGRRGEYVADTVTVASPSMPYVSKRPAGLLYAAELEVGKTYRVEFSDCCVRGEFTSVFAAGVGEDAEYWDELRFANGVTFTEWGQVEFWTVETDD